jgi:CheY-like chemotaxis protein
MLDQIFRNFAPADSPATRQHQGMGLGLAITNRLVEMMGGSLRAESQVGKGSKFFVDIKLPRDPQAGAADAADAALEGLRVLLVDPSEANRGFVHDQLESHGVTTRNARGGREALAVMHLAYEAGTPFDVALIDYNLPDTEGETLALEIKSDPNLAGTVLVAFTSVAGQRYASRMLLFGFAAIVVKPVRPSQLFRALARARATLDIGRREDRGASSAHKRSQGVAGQCRARILVAEDSMVNQKVVMRMLEKLDCAVDLAADGKQAVEMADAVHYDLIFMDCHMPEMDGFQATAVIRARTAENRTPIIALTANAMEGDRERCLTAGMDDYLAKPIKVSDLTNVLQRWAPAPAGSPR